uniref:Uncharacterized protein n=1 Tax=viral metagenome TaxID=1070528 RepID=A0A6C0JM03_9ZZZZ
MEQVIIRYSNEIVVFDKPARLHSNVWTFVSLNNRIVHVKTVQEYCKERIQEKSQVLRKPNGPTKSI